MIRGPLGFAMAPTCKGALLLKKHHHIGNWAQRGRVVTIAEVECTGVPDEPEKALPHVALRDAFCKHSNGQTISMLVCLYNSR